MIQRLIHRLKHFFDREHLTDKFLAHNNIYYKIFVDKKGRVCCPCCFRRLNVDWKMGWGPFDRLVRIEGCYLVPVVYIDGSNKPIIPQDEGECIVYCLDCPHTMAILESKEW